MSGLLVALDDPPGAPWVRMLDALEVLGGEERGSWFEPNGGAALARAYRREAGTVREAAIVHESDCVVVLDGRLTDEATGGGGERLSDSRRIVESYLRWGDECSAHLAGEFAFALWDCRRRRLLCACDVMGRRTIAFHWDGRVFLAVTRAAALLHHPRVPARVDAVYAAQALCDLFVHPPGQTALAGVRRLRPGFCLSVDGAELVERRVDGLRLDRPSRTRDPRAVYEEFWEALDDATRERLRGVSRPCVLLSGGLDSACVARSVFRARGAAEAYSFLGQAGASVDERRAIRALLQDLPSLRWHEVEASTDPPFVELAEGGPLCDDPVIASGAFLPGRVRTWQAAVRDGFAELLDGEGGDEVFSLPMRFGDLLTARAWRAAASYLAAHPAWSSVLWRDAVVPRLPPALLGVWGAREHRRTQAVPGWLGADFRRSSEARSALDLHGEWLRRATFESLLPAMLENPPVAGGVHALRLLARGAGLDAGSPFFDRRVVELAARVPAALRVNPAHRKSFLRHAAEDQLPARVRWRPKREGLFYELAAAELASPRARSLLRVASTVPQLADWVDFAQVEGLLARAGAGPALPPRTLRQVRGLLALGGWWRRVEARAP